MYHAGYPRSGEINFAKSPPRTPSPPIKLGDNFRETAVNSTGLWFAFGFIFV